MYHKFRVIVGDPLHVSQPTASRAIHRISASLSRKINDYVKLPNNIDVRPIKDDFYKIRVSGDYRLYRWDACVDNFPS